MHQCGFCPGLGVAIVGNIDDPLPISAYNPITHGGHELRIWLYQVGMNVLHCKDGPERGTI